MAYANTHYGAPKLRAARSALTGAIYDVTTTLTMSERECARARLALVHGCAFCTTYRPARDRPGWADDPDVVPEAHYQHVTEWATWPGYSDRERIAIEFAERYATDAITDDDAFWENVHACFTDDEIMELGICCAAWLGFGRLNRMLEIDGGACALHKRNRS